MTQIVKLNVNLDWNATLIMKKIKKRAIWDKSKSWYLITFSPVFYMFNLVVCYAGKGHGESSTTI